MILSHKNFQTLHQVISLKMTEYKTELYKTKMNLKLRTITTLQKISEKTIKLQQKEKQLEILLQELTEAKQEFIDIYNESNTPIEYEPTKK